MQRIVIVGGGAGGLALATQLGKTLGRKGAAEITLVDAARTHVWKPLLHQLAAGSFDTHAEEIEFLAQARGHHFKFRLGRLSGIDRAAKTVQLDASYDEAGREITPAQTLAYDTLVIAVGSQTNDFGTAGAAEHTIKLDSPQAAKRFNDRLINACIRAQSVPRAAGSALTLLAIVALGVVIAVVVIGGVTGQSDAISQTLGAGVDKVETALKDVGVDKPAAVADLIARYVF
jgi:NADH dehydrogenase